NQDQVGRQLGVSRSKVSRMLKEARERGLVEISIHYPARFSLDLERQLEAELGLREAVVVNASGVVGSQVLSWVAGAASGYVRRAMARLASCTVALIGIGALKTNSPGGAAVGSPDAGPSQRCHRRRLPVTEDEVTELRDVGAVGEICARFFDSEGQPCRTSLD